MIRRREPLPRCVLGARLELLCEETGTARAALAAVLDVNRTTLYKWRRCGDDLDQARRLRLAADHFGVSVDWLLGRTDDRGGYATIALAPVLVPAAPAPPLPPDLAPEFRRLLLATRDLFEGVLADMRARRLPVEWDPRSALGRVAALLDELLPAEAPWVEPDRDGRGAACRGCGATVRWMPDRGDLAAALGAYRREHAGCGGTAGERVSRLR